MTTHPFSLTITEAEKGIRLDKVLATHLTGHSRNVLQKAIEAGEILVNEKKVKKDYTLKMGDIVSGTLAANEEPSVEPDESVPFSVVYDAPDFAVIDKPAGVVVHPSYTHKKGTLVNGLVARWPQILSVGEHSFRPGIVHRLDKETSGLMAVAKTNDMFHWLKKQFKEHKVAKKYTALVFGEMKKPEVTVSVPIGRVGMRQVAGHDKDFREASTQFKVVKVFKGFTLVEAIPLTGRMHQIRVHLKHIGHAVVGDKKYTPAGLLRSFPLERQFLHASSLSFVLPDGKQVSFTSMPPDDLKKALSGLEG